MYDMYPEWGPARHRTDDTSHEAVRASMDSRDSGRDRPDDC